MNQNTKVIQSYKGIYPIQDIKPKVQDKSKIYSGAWSSEYSRTPKTVLSGFESSRKRH